MKTVYIVAWEYESGGGFDWYHTKKAADKAFIKEKENCDCPELKAAEWTAVQYQHETSLTDPVTITDEITAICTDLFDKAPLRYPVKKEI